VPLSNPALIRIRARKRIVPSALGTNERLMLRQCRCQGFGPAVDTDATTHEYHLGGTTSLASARRLRSNAPGIVLCGADTPRAAADALWQSVLTVAGVGLLVILGTLGALSFTVNRLLRSDPPSRRGRGADRPRGSRPRIAIRHAAMSSKRSRFNSTT